MFRLHATFLSDAEFLVIFPVLGARGSVLTSVERRIDSTERYESNRRLLSLRFGVSARPHVTMVYPKSAKLRPTTLPAELVACKQRMCWHGRLGRDARSACRTTPQGSSLSRARRIVSARGLGPSYQTRRQKLFRRSVLEAAAHVERACKTGGPESFFLPQLRVIEATRKGNETGLHTCCPARLHYVTCTAALQLAFCGGVLPASAMWPRAYFSSSFAGL